MIRSKHGPLISRIKDIFKGSSLHSIIEEGFVKFTICLKRQSSVSCFKLFVPGPEAIPSPESTKVTVK